MKQIPVDGGKYFALVDDEDFEKLSKYVWYYSGGDIPERSYAIRNFRIGDDDWTHRRMHRMILDAKKGEIIDHADGNRLNCQRYNIRKCNGRQNMQNQGLSKNNTSGYKGVRWNKVLHKFQSQICVNYKNYHLGLFDDKIEAAKAYNEKAKELFGEFARLNIIHD